MRQHPPHGWIETLFAVMECRGFKDDPMASAMRTFMESQRDASGGTDMPRDKCPDGCDPNVCEWVYLWYSSLWKACNGNPACEAQVYTNYHAALIIQCSQS